MATTGLEVIRQMVERTNAHDLEGMAALMHKDYQSEQPFHPARGFGGRAQMKANWGAILVGVPDLRAEVPASGASGTGGARPRRVSRLTCARSPSSRCGTGSSSGAGSSPSLSSSRTAPTSTTLWRPNRATAHNSRTEPAPRSRMARQLEERRPGCNILPTTARVPTDMPKPEF